MRTISMDSGRSSGSTVIELGMFTICSMIGSAQ